MPQTTTHGFPSVTTKSSVHLIVDAGHLAIASDLVPKKEVQEIYSKRNQQYTEQDYLQLEALMYDRFSVTLTAAQFVLGNDFDSCISALKAENKDGLHLLEKTNMEFALHNSIVPGAVQLSKIKVGYVSKRFVRKLTMFQGVWQVA